MKDRKLDVRPESPTPLWYMGDSRQVSREAKKYVREVCGITIIFWSKDTIYILGEYERFMITRWLDTYGTYKRWRNLALALQRRNKLTIADIRRLADKYEFMTQGIYSPPPAVEGITKLQGKHTWRRK